MTINSDLIAKYFADRENGLQNLTTLFETIVAQRDRAEENVRAHLHTIKKLSESFANITEPKTGKKISDPPPTPVRTMDAEQTPKTPVRIMNKPKSPKATALDDLDL